MALLGLIRRNLMECQKKIIENITKLDSNSGPTFVNHHVLSDVNFNGHCLINILLIFTSGSCALQVKFTI